MHQRIYGICDEQNLVEFVTWKMIAVAKTNPKPAEAPPSAGVFRTPPRAKSSRQVYLDSEIKLATVPVYAGPDCAGHAIRGPAIVEEETMTLLFLAGMTAIADADGNYWVSCD
jgi:N-methylhydantoinase A/oxoprolinase/acetone carboxylase beta subunit